MDWQINLKCLCCKRGTCKYIQSIRGKTKRIGCDTCNISTLVEIKNGKVLSSVLEIDIHEYYCGDS